MSHSSLRQRLLKRRPYLAAILGKLNDCELAQLATAAVDDDHAIAALCASYREYTKQLRGDDAAIHGSGLHKRASTASAKPPVITSRTRPASATTSAAGQLRIGELELGWAVDRLKVD